MSTELTKCRLLYLDYLKAFAISLVIVYHCHAFDRNIVASSVLSMCVNIFFCINGYLMLRKQQDPIKLLKKNFKILFLIILWGGISVFTTTWLLDDDKFDPATMFQHLINTDAGYCDYLWFLLTLVILNFINPVIYYFLTHASKTEKIIAIAFIGLCSIKYLRLIVCKFNPLEGWYGFSLFYYILGYLCLYSNDIKIGTKALVLLFVSFLLLQSVCNYAVLYMDNLKGLAASDIVFNQYSSIFVICSTLILTLLFKRTNFGNNKIVSFIGQNTLGIYLVQDVVIKYLRLGLGMTNSPIVCVILSMVICCLLVYAFNKIVFLRYLISV